MFFFLNRHLKLTEKNSTISLNKCPSTKFKLNTSHSTSAMKIEMPPPPQY